MQIISSSSEIKTLLPDIGVIGSRGMMRKARMCVKITSSVAVTMSSTSNWIPFNTVVVDNYNCFRPAISSTRLYAPQTGWYLANVYVRSATATAHDAVLQIHNNSLNSFFAYKKWNVPAGSTGFPNGITLSGVAYVQEGVSFYSNWGVSVGTPGISSLTGESNIGFGLWKLS